MKVQYSIAAMYNCVVLGTDHAAEAVTGFYTKYGDGGADLMPIFRLNKRQGKQLLKAIRLSRTSLFESSNCRSWKKTSHAIPDEVALGVTYDDIDDYLEGKKFPVEAQEKN